ncbi:MAG: choice-of-anchor A family protein [Steroidobacteraceae bacterium]
MKLRGGIWIGVLGLALNGTAAAGSIAGPAAGYNVFIFGNGSFISQDTDTMGNLAAGGNVSLTSYQVAQGIAGDPAQNPNPARLVVGGALTTQNGGSVGSNGDGTIYYNTITPILNNNGPFTAGGGTVANQTAVDFANSQNFYTGYSQLLGALAGTGSTTLSGSTLTLSGTNSGLNVFTIDDGSSALLLSSINISAPANSTVLINVTGSGAVTFGQGSVNYSGGVTGAAVLYNLVSAGSVQLFNNNTGQDPKASILAPDAGVTGGFGVMTGQLIAGSYAGETQFNSAAFNGALPAPVPLPGSVGLLGAGLLGAMGWIRRGAAPCGKPLRLV